MKPVAITALALLAGLATGPLARAATYTAHYDYVGKPALPDSQIDPRIQADTVTCDGMAGVQRMAPSANYRSCMRQRGWQYRYVTRDRDSAQPANPNGTVKYYDPDQGLYCTRTDIVSVCSNF